MPLQRPMLRMLWWASLDRTASPVGRVKPIVHRLRVCWSKEGAPLNREERQWRIKLDKNEWQIPRGNTVPYSQVGGSVWFSSSEEKQGYGKQEAPLCSRSLRTEGQLWAAVLIVLTQMIKHTHFSVTDQRLFDHIPFRSSQQLCR